MLKITIRGTKTRAILNAHGYTGNKRHGKAEEMHKLEFKEIYTALGCTVKQLSESLGCTQRIISYYLCQTDVRRISGAVARHMREFRDGKEL